MSKNDRIRFLLASACWPLGLVLAANDAAHRHWFSFAWEATGFVFVVSVWWTLFRRSYRLAFEKGKRP